MVVCRSLVFQLFQLLELLAAYLATGCKPVVVTLQPGWLLHFVRAEIRLRGVDLWPGLLWG